MIIIGRSDRKTWKVPEDMNSFVKECLDDNQGYYNFAELSYSSNERRGWVISYFCKGMPFDYTRQYFLDPSLFTVSDESMISRESVQKVFEQEVSDLSHDIELFSKQCPKEYPVLQVMKGALADLYAMAFRLSINLGEQTNIPLEGETNA